MSEEHEPKPLCGWVRLFHPSGVQVTLPVPCNDLGKHLDTYANALGAVGAMLEAGFLASAPGTAPGEEVDEIGWVVRREKENQDRSITPVIDLFVNNEGMKHSIMSVYLNSEEDVATFQRATGLLVSALPLYEGARIERGKATATDRKVVRLPKPARCAWAPNERYDEAAAAAARAAGDVYKVAKRKFLRWLDVPPPVPEPTGDEVQAAVTQWGDWLKTDPAVSEINDRLGGLSAMHAATKKRVWATITRHAELSNLEFDSATKRFAPRREAAATSHPF